MGNFYENLCGDFLLEISVDIGTLNLVLKCCLEVIVGATSGGKDLRRRREPLRSRGSDPFLGWECSVPRRAPLHAPRPPSRSSAAILSPGTPEARSMGRAWHGRSAEGDGRRSGL